MNKKCSFFYVCFPLLFSTFFSNAQAPNWQWAKSAGGAGYIEAQSYLQSVAVDAAGNSYVVGWYDSPTITFGSITLTNNDNTGNSDDLFFVKYDVNGNVVWAKGAGGAGSDDAQSIAVDGSGNIYITGWFSSPTLTIGSTTLINGGLRDIFLVKYDANGNIIWAKGAGGTGSEDAQSITVDGSGNIYVVGWFNSPTFILGTTTLTNTGSIDLFLVKYDANGNVIWAKGAGGTDNDFAYSVKVDGSGNIYTTGCYYSPTLIFGTTTLTNAGSDDLFLVKCDASGNVIWAKSAGGTSDDLASSIALDGFGNIYITGYFYSSTISFGSNTLTNGSIFLVKYAANGNVVWAKSAGGVNDDNQASSIAVDASGNSFVVGWFRSLTLTFGSTTLTNADTLYYTVDLFLVKYDANGNVIWAKGAIGMYDDGATSVAVDGSGNTYVAGVFRGPTLIFGSTTLTVMNTAGDYDVFLAKSGSTSGMYELSNSLSISVFPNPATNILTIETPNMASIEILNIQGQQIKTIAASNNKTTFDISSFTSGMYLVKVKTETGIEVKKFVKE